MNNVHLPRRLASNFRKKGVYMFIEHVDTLFSKVLCDHLYYPDKGRECSGQPEWQVLGAVMAVVDGDTTTFLEECLMS